MSVKTLGSSQRLIDPAIAPAAGPLSEHAHRCFGLAMGHLQLIGMQIKTPEGGAIVLPPGFPPEGSNLERGIHDHESGPRTVKAGLGPNRQHQFKAGLGPNRQELLLRNREAFHCLTILNVGCTL